MRRPCPTGGCCAMKSPYTMLRRILGSERLKAVGGRSK